MVLNLSLDLDGAAMLVVGAGKAASRKLNYLAGLLAAQAAPRQALTIRVIALEAAPEFLALTAEWTERSLDTWVKLEYQRRGWEDQDLDLPGLALVWSFTGQGEVDAAVARSCRERGIPCNASTPGASCSSPPSRLREDGGRQFLVSVASLEGSERTRGHDPMLAKALLDRLVGENPAPAPVSDSPLQDERPPFLPMMLGLERVLVFAGERGEGLQKTEKLALFARQVTIVAEDTTTARQLAPTGTLLFPAGPVRYVAEPLVFPMDRRVGVLPRSAAWYLARPWRLRRLLAGVDYVCSDLADAAANAVLDKACRKRGIRHTVVDTKALSDTWFMSLVEAGPLLAGISSRGSCAFYARKIREEVQADFARRAPMARLLGAIRAALPREGREAALSLVYGDGAFRDLMARGQTDLALDRACELVQSHGHTLAHVTLKEAYHGQSR